MAAAGASLALLHFGFPLAYYAYLTRRRDLGVEAGPSYTPRVDVVLPTYMEAGKIASKLDEIYGQDYPRDKLRVIVVDGASPDGTAEAAERWAEAHRDMRVSVVREPARRGKGSALNDALRLADGEVVVVADADARWIGRSALRRAVSYLADPAVGAVTCVKSAERAGPAGAESAYRRFYDEVRIAESAVHSTPIFHGELAAFRRSLVESFPLDVGADDSWTALSIALRGYRAVAAPDVECVEAVPARGYFRWRVRRAQHLLQAFAKALPRIRGAPPRLRPVLAAEAHLHLLNPWLLAAGVALLAAAAALGSAPAALLLAAGAAATALRPYRAWMVMQAALMAAALRNLRSRELVWRKDEK